MIHLGVLGLEAGVADGSAAEVRGQKRAIPIIQATVREGRTNGHVGRQIFVFRTKPVTNPRAHARPHKIIRTGMQLQQRAAMGGVCAVCAVDKTDVIHMPRHVREEFANHVTALAVRLELPRRGQQVAGLGEGYLRLVKRQRLPVITLEQWLVLEGVHVRRAAFHKQKNDALGPRPEMRTLGRQRILRLQQRRQRQRPKAEGGLLQHVAAGGHFKYRNSLDDTNA